MKCGRIPMYIVRWNKGCHHQIRMRTNYKWNVCVCARHKCSLCTSVTATRWCYWMAAFERDDMPIEMCIKWIRNKETRNTATLRRWVFSFPRIPKWLFSYSMKRSILSERGNSNIPAAVWFKQRIISNWWLHTHQITKKPKKKNEERRKPTITEKTQANALWRHFFVWIDVYNERWIEEDNICVVLEKYYKTCDDMTTAARICAIRMYARALSLCFFISLCVF